MTLTVKKDDTVKIDQVIGFVDTDAKAPAQTTPVQSSPPQGQKPAAAPFAEPQKSMPPPPSREPKKVEGESARVMMSDFAAAAKEGPKGPPPSTSSSEKPTIVEEKVTRKKMSDLRKVIAARLVEAKNTTAMLTTFNEVDMSAVMEIRNREKDNFLKKYGVKLGFMSFFVKAVCRCPQADSGSERHHRWR